MVLPDGFTPFYSTFLGFLVYHWFPQFAVLGTKTNVVSVTLVVGPFLIFSLFSLFEDPHQRSLADLPLLGGPKGWPPKLLNTTFQTHFLATLLFVIFSKLADFSLSGWKIPSHLSLWSISLGSSRYQTFFHEVLVPRSSAFFCIIGWLMGHIYSHSLCSWACSLELCQSQLGLLLHILRIPGLWESPGILVHLSLWVP